MRLNARNVCAYLLAKLLIMLGFVRRSVKKAMNGEYILCICFHKPTKAEFERSVKWLKKNGFTFLSTAELEDIIKGKLSFPTGGVVLTVDDGWQSNESSIVKVANYYGIPVTIFVSTAPVEGGTYWWSYLGNNKAAIKSLKRVSNDQRLEKVDELKRRKPLERQALTIEQVKHAAESKYITIGGHTHSHPILPKCKDEESFEELRVSKEKLEAWTGEAVSCFAYPNGDYSNREIQMLERLNYHFAFSTDPQYLTADLIKNKYELPRFGYLEGASLEENICRMVGVWSSVTKRVKRFYK